jgi:hypothetical protein
MTVHLWAIGGHYDHAGFGAVRVEVVKWNTVKATSLSKNKTFKDFKSQFRGPTHLPCPYCGELQIMNSESGLAAMRGEGQIDFPEHMMRCRP